MMLSLHRHGIKYYISVILIGVLLFISFCNANCLAHDRDEHNRILDRILFGSESGNPDSWAERIDMLHKASYLTLDQANGEGQTDLDALNEFNVPRIPKTISEINVRGNYTHRRYTHLGWDYDDYPNDSHWDSRQSILINTVGKVFNFSQEWNWDTYHFEYNNRANSMAAFIYYVHLLGDYQYDYGVYPYHDYSSYMMPLASGATGSSSVISEIKTHLQVVCAEQVDTYVFNGLMTELTQYDSQIYSVVHSSTGVLTDEEYEELNDLVNDVIEALVEHVPGLLREESFFSDTFPENGETSTTWDWVPWNKHD